jgi:ribonuclease HI
MKYYSDGFILEHNPSKRGGGYTIFDEDDNKIETRCFLRPMTNNEAELLGVVRALEIAKKGDMIVTDSQNTIRWILSMRHKKLKKKRARKDLDDIKKKAYLLSTEKNISVVWEQRDTNLAGQFNEWLYNA